MLDCLTEYVTHTRVQSRTHLTKVKCLAPNTQRIFIQTYSLFFVRYMRAHTRIHVTLHFSTNINLRRNNMSRLHGAQTVREGTLHYNLHVNFHPVRIGIFVIYRRHRKLHINKNHYILINARVCQCVCGNQFNNIHFIVVHTQTYPCNQFCIYF